MKNQKPNENQCFLVPLGKTHASRNEKSMQKTLKNQRKINKKLKNMQKPNENQ